jgi:hypothetical protein
VKNVQIAVKKHDSAFWGDLTAVVGHHTVEVIAERFKCKNEKYSFTGGHRVRLFKLTKNVHFKIPTGRELDISAVRPGAAPRRGQHA